MAAPAPSPSGFSYAQAAKGRSSTTSSQLPSSKVTSGTTTPATGVSTDPSPAGNWAESVESSVETSLQSLQKSSEPPSKPASVKDVAVERTKSESRPQRAPSGIPSPDLAASTTTTATDDSLSARNGTPSDSTWETKSQASEPAWIADRKERQGNEGGGKGSKKDSEESSPAPAPPKPALQEAPPPAVNPWAKRAEDAKTKPAAAAPGQLNKSIPTSAPMPDSKDINASKVEQQKKVETGARDAAALQIAGVDTKKPSVSQKPGGNEARGNGRQPPKLSHEDARAGIEQTPSARSIQRDSRGAASPLPPPSTDQLSWPTPDSVPDNKERKDTSADKDGDDTNEADATQGTKAPKKTWKVLPVTPNILWETQEMNRPRGPAGDKGPRSSNGNRARGSFRGGANGPKGGDRASAKASQEADASLRGRQAAADRDAMPPPPRPSIRGPSIGQPRDTNEPKPVGLAITGGDQSATGQTGQFNSQRNKSPNTPNNIVGANGQDPTKVPSPIPHNSSASVQSKDANDISNSTRDIQSNKSIASDSKKEARSFEAYGKEWNGPSRGGKRGGRGRGGSREFANGHQASSPYHAGYPDFAAGANLYGVPSSPSNFQSPRGGNHLFAHSQQQPQQQQGRGGWARSGQRAQSIPLDNMYNNGNNGRFPAFNQMAPMSGYMPTAYDQYGFPMSAVPYSPVMDQQYLMDMVSTQLEYYFSVDNLLKDMFLRKNMDSQGFVFLDVIANFNRIKQLTVDKDLLRAVCLRSETIEIRVGDDNKERLRKREDWDKFLLPMEQREASAQNEGPAQLQRPEQPQLWGRNTMGFRSQGNVPSHPRRSYDSGFAGMNGVAPSFAPFAPLMQSQYADSQQAEETRGRTHKSPMRDISIPPNHTAANGAVPEEKDDVPDVFANENISTLTVVVNPHRARVPPPHVASRTYSNGSIDPRALFNPDSEKATDDHMRVSANGDASTNGDDSKRSLSRVASPSYGRSPDKEASSSEISLFWVKDREMPMDSLPTGAALEPYTQLRFKALDQRSRAATGTCPYDLDVLYQFWSHFLIRNFNNKMYTEFKFFAHDDASQRSSTGGLQNLVQFYAKALASSNSIRDRVVNDYVNLIKNEPVSLEGQAFKQLRSAWRNGALNLKNRKKLADIVDDALRERLESCARSKSGTEIVVFALPNLLRYTLLRPTPPPFPRTGQ